MKNKYGTLKKQIIQLRDKGKSYKEIAQLLNCTKSVVAYHCKNLAINPGTTWTYREDIVRHKTCVFCDKPLISGQMKFCSNQCQGELQVVEMLARFLNGDVSHPQMLRKYMKLTSEYKCYICSLSVWNGQDITLEIEHKDGNSENNHPDNLEWICPNCHSQTPFYKVRNKGNGRHARRQRYAEGKSY